MGVNEALKKKIKELEQEKEQNTALHAKALKNCSKLFDETAVLLGATVITPKKETEDTKEDQKDKKDKKTRKNGATQKQTQPGMEEKKEELFNVEGSSGTDSDSDDEV